MEWSSIKVMKYSAPLRALVDIGLQMFECIKPNTLLALLLLLWYVALAYAPSADIVSLGAQFWNSRDSLLENS